MANPAHEALLRQGLQDWNQWRRDNGSVTPDLSGIALSAANLKGANFSQARLKGAVLIRSRLEGADLSYADLREAHLHEVDLTGADLYRANLERAALPGAKLPKARFFGANLRCAQITVVDFRNADLREADLTGADLRESLGAGASLERARLERTELFGCRLSQVNLMGATGLSSRQLQSAVLDETTILPDSFATGASEPTIHSLMRAIEEMRARSTGLTVTETEVSSYHALLHKLEIRGFDTEKARIAEEELIRAVASWERTPGGEAFEVSPIRSVDATLFVGRIDAILSELRGKTS